MLSFDEIKIIIIIVFLRSVHLERVTYNREFSVTRVARYRIFSVARKSISACDYNNIKVLYQSVDTKEYNLVTY